MNLWDMGLIETAEGLSSGRFSATELVQAYLERIERWDPLVRSYLTLTGEEALRQAAAVDEARARGESQPPFAGVPLAYKDNMATRGVPTTCASRILEGYRPAYDAAVVERLSGQGFVMLGKTNLDEFAMGSSSENSAFQVTRNPWDVSRVPGGSSSGSAAAVAAGLAPLALGSDTGGSIRQPASFCGVVGLKPTYGRVSRYGLVAYASSLDQIGPLARTVEDAAVALGLIAGVDPRDQTSADLPVGEYRRNLAQGVEGLRFGIPEEFLGSGVDPAMREAVQRAASVLEAAGARGETCSLPSTPYALAAYYLIAPAEASSNLARYDGIRYGAVAPGTDLLDLYERTRDQGFGPEVKRRIMLGSYALSAGYYDAYYLRAQKVRTLIRQEFEEAFGRYAFLLAPTSPTVAFPIGERAGDPLRMYAADILTIPANLAGIPALSVPFGLSEGLPVGVQVMGPLFGEEVVLRAGAVLEQAEPPRRPVLEQSGGKEAR